MDQALTDYQGQRDAAALPMYKFTCQLARFEPPSYDMRQLFAGLHASPADASRFFGVFAGRVPLAEFFAPENVTESRGSWLCRVSGPTRPAGRLGI
jgi:hypothetical protein